jgi:hypothetical protein
MKAIKISLAVIVVVAIGFFVIRSLIPTKPIEPPPLPENQFTNRIEREIDSVGKFSDSTFCSNFYNEVAYHIEDYYKQGRLGNGQSENDQWKENLSKKLYSAYADKFIKQAFYVFRHKEWSINDLRFIRSEYQTLQKSKLLEKASPVDKDFIKMKTIFSKYDEIVNFISSCTNYSYSSKSLSDNFPIDDVQDKIQVATTFINNSLENEFVNNCTRLHNDLDTITQILFKAHVKYLDNKIDQWSGMYPNYKSQNEYTNNLHNPLQSEIDNLRNNIYNVANCDSECDRLSSKWSADNVKAYNYTYPK